MTSEKLRSLLEAENERLAREFCDEFGYSNIGSYYASFEYGANSRTEIILDLFDALDYYSQLTNYSGDEAYDGTYVGGISQEDMPGLKGRLAIEKLESKLKGAE